MRAYRYRMMLGALALVAVASSCLAVGTPSEVAGWVSVMDVNDAGVMVGLGPTQASRYDTVTGVATPIGTLGGVASSRPSAINDSGSVVGVAPTATGAYQAFLLDTGSPMRQLGTLTPAATSPRSGANDINSAGAIVGWSNLETGATDAFHAVVFDHASGTPQDLGTLGGTSSEATAINDAGLIVGWSEVTVGSAVQHPFLYDPGTRVMHDIGTMGGIHATATDLNEHGTVVGWAETANCDQGCERKAFAYEHTTGSFVALTEGLHPEWFYAAEGINEDGVIVGRSVNPISCSACATIMSAVAWDPDAVGLYELLPQPSYSTADAINDSGLTVGTKVVPHASPQPPTDSAFWTQVTHLAS